MGKNRNVPPNRKLAADGHITPQENLTVSAGNASIPRRRAKLSRQAAFPCEELQSCPPAKFANPNGTLR
jgi:hypothetical protein